jgi:GNAT superfamily N-acetyltransferase
MFRRAGPCGAISDSVGVTMQTDENQRESQDEAAPTASFEQSGSLQASKPSDSSDSSDSPDSPDSSIEISTSYPPEVKRDLADGDEDPSRTHGYNLSWRPTETHIFVSVDGRKMCHVGLVRQTVEISGVSFDVAGAGGVLVRSGERGHGYGRAAMEAAEEFASREMKVGFMLLFCREAVRPWYDALGWRKVLGATWAEQPNGPIVLPLDSMWKSLNGARWPDGDVYLRSQPW